MEQLERARRYLLRMRAIYSGVWSDSHGRQECEDDVLSFFVHCYHIKDWIVRLNKLGITHRQVDSFIDSKECLSICTDLCNGTKHCTLTRPTRTGGQPRVAGKQYTSSVWLTGSGGGEIIQGKYSIVTSTGIVDALDLAEECMQCWSEYIDKSISRSAESSDRLFARTRASSPLVVARTRFDPILKRHLRLTSSQQSAPLGNRELLNQTPRPSAVMD